MAPNASVKFDDLLLAYEWVSSSPDGENDAFVSRVSGAVHWSSRTIEPDDELPEDIDDGSIYVSVPHKHDLDLGKHLALAFAEEQLKASFDTVASFFRQRGAYGRFKDLLQRKGLLQTWYDYEAKATEVALRLWCAEQGISIADGSGQDAG
jgi:hypothetical protein